MSGLGRFCLALTGPNTNTPPGTGQGGKVKGAEESFILEGKRSALEAFDSFAALRKSPPALKDDEDFSHGFTVELESWALWLQVFIDPLATFACEFQVPARILGFIPLPFARGFSIKDGEASLPTVRTTLDHFLELAPADLYSWAKRQRFLARTH